MKIPTALFVSLVILFTSCKDINKLVEAGKYDEALRYGVDKLKGKKNKKTDYVIALEKAYAKLNDRDLNEIAHLSNTPKKYSFDRIVDIYIKMEARQNYVLPLLPLISEDGYVATIDIRNYPSIIHEAKLTAAEFHYNMTLGYMIDARSGNKSMARNAFHTIENIEYYIFNYKDTHSLKKEAYDLGQQHILLETYADGSNIAFDHAMDIISRINIEDMNTLWTKYHNVDDGKNYDYIVTIELNDILPGVEREKIRLYSETKEIVDKHIPSTDRSGKIHKDSLGNTIFVDVRKVVNAEIEEISRLKEAEMIGKIVVLNNKTNTHNKTTPIHINNVFDDTACILRGDERALSDITKSKIKSNPQHFPSDYDMTMNLAYSYKETVENLLKKERYILD